MVDMPNEGIQNKETQKSSQVMHIEKIFKIRKQTL